MKSNQSYCLGGRHYSQTVNKKIFEKLNLKSMKLFKTTKGKCSIGGRKKSQNFTK